MKNKSFDAAELQDRAAQRLYEQLKGLTLAEQFEFWQKRTESLQAQQRSIQRRPSKVAQSRRPSKSEATRRSKRDRH